MSGIEASVASQTAARIKAIRNRLRLPVIAAPMLRISNTALVMATCRAGVIGAFPTANARSSAELDAWLTEIEASVSPGCAPWCPNLIIRQPRIAEDLACLVRHRVEMVITSVGSPQSVVAPLHEVGCLVFADVATLRHAHRAVAAGADGLVLLTAGAGGQTGWVNAFAFVRAVREFFAGPIVLAGGVCDGYSIRAAEVLGCDFSYLGTRFIASTESSAAPAYKQMLVDSTFDDVLSTAAFTGLDTNMLRPSIVRAGLDPERLDETITPKTADEQFGGKSGGAVKRWTDVWSAGHSVVKVHEITSAGAIVDELYGEYCQASALPTFSAGAAECPG
jgi:nitronate monooxygenase